MCRRRHRHLVAVVRASAARTAAGSRSNSSSGTTGAVLQLKLDEVFATDFGDKFGRAAEGDDAPAVDNGNAVA